MNRIGLTAFMAMPMLLAGMARAAEYSVAPASAGVNDNNPGTADKPFKTLAKALAAAKAGDTILLGDGECPAVSITSTYDPPLAICAAKGARPVFVGGLLVKNGGGLRVSGVKFTWPGDKKPQNKLADFIRIEDSRNVEIADCEIVDTPSGTEWVGKACEVKNSQRVTIRNVKAHHIYFGFALTYAKDVVLRDLEIGPWSYEDGVRTTECEGPILIEGCHITNTAVAGNKGGHVDGIQILFWNDDLTIRNCRIHDVPQAIGAFQCTGVKGSGDPNRRRKNFRVEGNLIYDVYGPHVCTLCEVDDVVVVNNTFPNGVVNLSKCTGGVVKNNIFGGGSLRKECVKEVDYNLWISGGEKYGEHDLVGVDPKFVNAPLLTVKTSESRRQKDATRSKFYVPLKGKIAVGDMVELMNSDSAGRDGRLRKVTAVGDEWFEVDTPLNNDPAVGGVTVYKWPPGQKNLTPDYRLAPDSPAIDSADAGVGRGKDMDGHAPFDAPAVKDAGSGKTPYLDRGAFEHVPTASSGATKTRHVMPLCAIR
jgi:hypothetical protein